MIILKNIPLYALSNFIRHCNEQLWKNIAEIKSFSWVVLAFEKWVPKSEKRGDLWRHIMRGYIDIAWSLWRSIMQVALMVQQWRHNLHSWTGTCYNNKGACLRRIN